MRIKLCLILGLFVCSYTAYASDSKKFCQRALLLSLLNNRVDQLSAQETSERWIPSDKVKKMFERDPELKQLLELDPSAVIHVEMGFFKINSRRNNEYLYTSEHPRYPWWVDYIETQWKDNPDAVKNYKQAIAHLEAHHGEELQFLISHGVEILKPETGSILFGTFGVKGPLQAIAEALDNFRAIVAPTSWRPRRVAFGALPPAPRFDMDAATKQWLNDKSTEITKNVLFKFKTLEDANKTLRTLDLLKLSPEQINVDGEAVPFIKIEVTNRTFDSVILQNLPIHSIHASNPSPKVGTLPVNKEILDWIANEPTVSKSVEFDFLKQEDFNAAWKALIDAGYKNIQNTNEIMGRMTMGKPGPSILVTIDATQFNHIANLGLRMSGSSFDTASRIKLVPVALVEAAPLKPYFHKSAQEALAALKANESGKLTIQIQVPFDFDLDGYITSKQISYEQLVVMPDGSKHSVGVLHGTKAALEAFARENHDPKIKIEFISSTNPAAVRESRNLYKQQQQSSSYKQAELSSVPPTVVNTESSPSTSGTIKTPTVDFDLSKISSFKICKALSNPMICFHMNRLEDGSVRWDMTTSLPGRPAVESYQLVSSEKISTTALTLKVRSKSQDLSAQEKTITIDIQSYQVTVLDQNVNNNDSNSQEKWELKIDSIPNGFHSLIQKEMMVMASGSDQDVFGESFREKMLRKKALAAKLRSSIEDWVKNSNLSNVKVYPGGFDGLGGVMILLPQYLRSHLAEALKDQIERIDDIPEAGDRRIL